jgi:hypothetical protein
VRNVTRLSDGRKQNVVIDHADARIICPSDVDVASKAPAGTPRVADDPVASSGGVVAPADQSDCVVNCRTACSCVGQHTSSVRLEVLLACIDGDSHHIVVRVCLHGSTRGVALVDEVGVDFTSPNLISASTGGLCCTGNVGISAGRRNRSDMCVLPAISVQPAIATVIAVR